MTGAELRQKCVNIMNGWVGGAYQGAAHKEIIQIWNAGKDSGQYTMNMTAPYCAATVSAAWIKAGIGAYVPKDTYVPTMATKAKSMGIWIENDKYTPKAGDAVLYDWDDGSNYANYDNTGEPDHVGMVVKVSGSSFVVAEGNMSGGKIGTRNMQVNGRYIRGFIVPDYDAIAKKLGGSDTYTEGWVKDDKGWWYRYSDGTWPASKWLKLGGKWYWFGSDGYMAENQWQLYKGCLYYLGSDGAMVTGKDLKIDSEGRLVPV